VVDGGSTDATLSIAREFTDKVLVTGKGRGLQMNLGARNAAGEILLFLHADCTLPEGGFRMIRQALKDSRVSAGAFDLSIEHPGLRYRIVEFGANLRSRLTSIPYGDQGMFLRKEVFDLLGGFADVPLMEDMELSSRLKKMGKIVFLRPPIRTLPRRWLDEGVAYTTLRDWSIALSYRFLRVPPRRLLKYYRDIR
jgi:rSAM/selenodomain-associated transferase 2